MTSPQTPTQQIYWGLRVDRLLLGMTLTQWQQFEPQATDGLLWQFPHLPKPDWNERMQTSLSQHACRLRYRPDKPTRELYLIFPHETHRQDCFAKLRRVLNLPSTGHFLMFQGKNHPNLTLAQVRADYTRTWRKAFAWVNAHSHNPTVQAVGSEITDVFIALYRVTSKGRRVPLVAWDRPWGQKRRSDAKSIGGKMEYHRGRSIFAEAVREMMEELNLTMPEMATYFPGLSEPRRAEEVWVLSNDHETTSTHALQNRRCPVHFREKEDKNPITQVVYFVEVRWTDAQWSAIQAKVKRNQYDVIGVDFVPTTWESKYRLGQSTRQALNRRNIQLLPVVADQFLHLEYFLSPPA